MLPGRSLTGIPASRPALASPASTPAQSELPTIEQMQAAVAKIGGGKAKPLPKIYSPYITGHCLIGNHEGSKNLSEKGSLQVACRGRYVFPRGLSATCTCECHASLYVVEEMIAQRQRESLPGVSDDAASTERPVTIAMDSPSDPVTEPATPQSHLPMRSLTTTGGRQQRGNLEELVWAVVRGTFVTKLPEFSAYKELTPQNIAFEIRLAVHGAYEPSTGAIHAVLKRWAAVCWIYVEESPYRVVRVGDILANSSPTELKDSIDQAARRVMRGH